ncbi:MAG: CoA transferase [Gammaproteobacteria bacterium]|nr:CoA transferase [Gammaproteobacteria bacterium]
MCRIPRRAGSTSSTTTNKRGIRCDVSNEAGRAVFLRLVAWADLLIENNAPAQMRAWGSITPAWLPRTRTSSWSRSHRSARPVPTATGTATTSTRTTSPVRAAATAGARMKRRSGTAPLRRIISAQSRRQPRDWQRSTAGGGRAAGSTGRVHGRGHRGRVRGRTGHRWLRPDRVFDKRLGVACRRAPATISPAKDGHVWMLALEPAVERVAQVMGDPEWGVLQLFGTCSSAPGTPT